MKGSAFSKFIAVLLTAAALCGAYFGVTAYLKAHAYYSLSYAQIEAVLAANDYEDETSRVIAESAASLVGKVHYFWGGKSFVKGWDDRWGSLAPVESAGSPTTGETRPFGLDCSGYITWIFMQTDIENARALIGEGTYNQWMKSSPIEWSDIRIGDLVFRNEYPGASSNHVAVCIGFLNGRPVFAHCSSAQDNVVVTTAGNVFKSARRPNLTPAE